MYKCVFAIILSNPFERQPIILYKDSNINITREVTKLLEFGIIVAFDFDATIESFRKKGIAKLPFIIDTSTAIKLITGLPKSKFRDGDEPWSLKRLLGSRVSGSSLALLDKFQKLKMTGQDFVEQSKANISEIMDGFEDSWNRLSQELVAKGEKDRFYDVENPLYNIFLQTRLRGIFVPKDKLHAKVISINTITDQAGRIRISYFGSFGFRSKRLSISRIAFLVRETPFW